MPGENLTRAEARERAGLVSTESYSVALDLTTGEETFLSSTVIRFGATPGASTFLDAIPERIHSVTLNGVELDAGTVSDGVRIQLDGLLEENEVRVVADFAYVNTGQGLHRFVDPVDGEAYLYSQFEVPDARRVYANFEQPDLKAEFTFEVAAPAHWTVVSNAPSSTPETRTDGAAIWRFATTPRISSYITAIVAGPYAQVHSQLTSRDGRTIPLGVYCRESLARFLDADYIFGITRAGFAFFEEAFDYPYPFEKYDQLFVPEFNAGAMENAGCVTHTEAYVFRGQVADAMRERRVVTILHELAHMWFGDLVTMRWWNDLWLNESFAEYMSTLATAEATEWVNDWTTFSSSEKSWAYRQDQLPSTHPIVAPIEDFHDVEVNFDGITYAKGASVLKQLVAWVGREAFFAGLRRYFVKHAHGNTELADLLAELEATSGRDLTSWSRLWLETAGVNTLRVEVDTDPSGRITGFAVTQSAAEDHPTIRPHRIGIGLYSRSGDRVVRTSRFEVDVDGTRTVIPELVGQTRPDLILLNDDDLAYAKIRLDEASLRFAIENLGRIEDPLARTLIWGAMWDATRDAETPARDFVSLVLGNVGAETESTAIRTIVGQLVTVASLYVAPATRADTLRRVGDGLWQLAQDAAPGSDSQFQFVKFFAAVARTPEHADLLAGLRAGRIPLDGLTIDTDLSWELLVGLVSLGRASEPEIASALAADDTATGRQAAARARAAIPTREAKERAMTSLLTDASLPNLIVRNTAAGLQRAVDPALLESVVEPYFGSIVDVWSSRNFHVAEEVIVGAFPMPLAGEALLDRANAWLAENADQPAALRRMILEDAAGVTRALRAQARDAE